MPSMRSLMLLATALCATFSSAIPHPPAGHKRASGMPSASASDTAPLPPVEGTQPPTSAVPSMPTTGVPAAPSAPSAPGPSSVPSAIPTAPVPGAGPGSSSYWFAAMDHSKDTVFDPDGNSAGYKVWRNVKDYGAAGDGTTDDTAAINKAMSDGNRCGNETQCDSSTVTPAILYFPAGTYKVSTPILMYYYTQMVGDATNPPTLLASSNFVGMAVIDADPYEYVDGGAKNWYTNQNNFFRQVRNFVIDIRQWGGGLAGAGIHWQVAQATSLQNIVFQMSDNPATKQSGVFMDNGSGGFMADLTFWNGQYGAFFGSQQFTTRNLTFNGCKTAIWMQWNWGWTLQGITVNGGGTGLDMSNSPTNQTVGSVLIADSKFNALQYGVRFAYQNTSANYYPTGGTLILDNVDMTGVSTGSVVTHDNTVILPGQQKIKSWASGNGYTASRKGTNTVAKPSQQENPINAPIKARSLLDPSGNIFARSRPQYEDYPVGSFVSAKSSGCAGDGQTDDTAAITKLLQQVAGTGQIAYFEHGAYLVKDTIQIPPNVKMTGSIWPLILADGPSFSDVTHPKPVFQIGQSGGQQGTFEISDIIFETLGPAPGAVMIEWNLQSPQGGSGMWDSHVRIGGSAGTNLEGPNGFGGCRNNTASTEVNKACEGVFLMFHATKPSGGVYLENTWFWVADHDLDHDQPKQISLYSARGVLVESQGPVWMWGTASEHSIMYNYQFLGAQAVFIGFMQSETPYMQPNPLAPLPFFANTAYGDPLFTICPGGTPSSSSVPCRDAWGLRIWNSKNVLIYGTGLYSFFNNYNQDCVGTHNCQQNMIHIQSSQVAMYMVNTANSVSMIIDDDMGTVSGADNRNWFCDTISYYFTDH